MSIIRAINYQQKAALAELIAWCGGESNLARLLGVSRQAVTNWKARGKISMSAAIEAEEMTEGKFQAKQLRPSVADWRRN